MGKIRTEQDLLGELTLPAECPWGIHTERARRNFALGHAPVSPRLIRAYALVKKACCLANAELGFLDAGVAAALAAACDEVAAGKHAESFPLDALQGGAGTSTNMNLNEVLANLALDRFGQPRGAWRKVHPLDHVNRHQSTNDTYPTALKIAAIQALRETSAAFQALQGALQRREQAFSGIVALGRTEGMGAVPMTLGQAFGAAAEAVSRDRWRTFKCEERLRVVNLGGTAVGNGLAAPRAYIFLVIEKLRQATGLGLSRAENVPGDTAHADVFVEVSGILKAAAVNLIKIGRDLRLLHMFGEIRLPAVQAGSSIMPGKVNPVIVESVMQAGMRICAEDAIVAQCASQGTLQICEFLPLLAQALLGAIELLTMAAHMLATHVDGIEADAEACARHLHASPGIVTAWVPAIGYEAATELVRRGTAEGVTDWRAFLAREFGAEKAAEILRPENLLALGYRERLKAEG
jgi:aspartate ammonia-lyase